MSLHRHTELSYVDLLFELSEKSKKNWIYVYNLFVN